MIMIINYDSENDFNNIYNDNATMSLILNFLIN